jgi:hypothetical protein
VTVLKNAVTTRLQSDTSAFTRDNRLVIHFQVHSRKSVTPSHNVDAWPSNIAFRTCRFSAILALSLRERRIINWQPICNLTSVLDRASRKGMNSAKSAIVRAHMIKDLLMRWPVVQQILTQTDGTGMEAASDRTRNLLPKHHGAQVARSVCPYAVGCGQLVYHRDGKLGSSAIPEIENRDAIRLSGASGQLEFPCSG